MRKERKTYAVPGVREYMLLCPVGGKARVRVLFGGGDVIAAEGAGASAVFTTDDLITQEAIERTEEYKSGRVVLVSREDTGEEIAVGMAPVEEDPPAVPVAPHEESAAAADYGTDLVARGLLEEAIDLYPFEGFPPEGTYYDASGNLMEDEYDASGNLLPRYVFDGVSGYVPDANYGASGDYFTGESTKWYQDYLLTAPDLKRAGASDEELTAGYGNYDGVFARFKNMRVFDTDLSWASSMRSSFKDHTKLLRARLNASQCATFARCFEGCAALITADVDVAEGAELERMFFGCGSLKTADVSGMSKGNGSNLREMFTGCAGLEQVQFLDFRAARDTRDMFKGCTSLKTLCIDGYGSMRQSYGEENRKLDLDLRDSKALSKGSIMGCFYYNAVCPSGLDSTCGLYVYLHEYAFNRLDYSEVALIVSQKSIALIVP